MTRADGSVHEWEANWRTLPARQKQLYARGVPRTILQFWQRCYFEDLWSAMGDRAASARYLELGSGRGTTSMYLSRRKCQVTMVDLSETAFRLAGENFARENLSQPGFVLADVRETGLPSASFDCVLNVGVLEHFEDPKPLLAEAFRLLSPGGLLFMIVVPARSERVRWLARLLFCPWRLLLHLLGSAARKTLRASPAQSGEAVHRTAYSRQEYEGWLRELGAENVSAVPYNPYHSVYRVDGLNRRLALPVYRLHHALKQRLGIGPALRTSPGIAACDLLCGRKPLLI